MMRREGNCAASSGSPHAGRPAARIAPSPRPRLARLDVMMVSAMLVIVASYALGYRLDWSQDPGLVSNVEEEDESNGAQIPAPASVEALQPPMPPLAEPAIVASAPEAWSEKPEDQEWGLMTQALGALAARHPGRVSIMLKDLKSGRCWTYHPDDLFPAASLIKVPVMISAFYKISEGELSLNEMLVLRRRTRVGGSGSLKWRPDGTRLSVSELLIHMINESDNTATAMVLDRLGIGWVQQQFPRMGLLYTGIYPEGMSIKGGRVAHENYTTAREMSMLLEKIYRGEIVDKDSSALMLEILKRRKAVPSRLAKGLPRGWEIAHKTGLLRMACHDSAIFFTPNGDYVMTVLTGQNRSYHAAKDFISRLGRITFRYYTGADQLARSSRRRQQLALR